MHPCFQDTANAHRKSGCTQRHFIPRNFFQGEHFPFSSAVGFFPPDPLNNLNIFCGKKKKKRKTTSAGSCIPSDHPGFSLSSGGQPGSIGHMTMVWTAKLLLCSGAGGLAVQPYMATKWKPWVLYWIYTQSHLTVQTTILGRENGGEKYSAHNFVTLAERWEYFIPYITSLVYILLYVPIWTYDNYGM